MIYKWNVRRLFTKESGITDSQTLPEDKQGSIIGDMTLTSRLFRFIDKFGLTTMVQFLKDLLFTTKTTTHSTTKLETSNSWQNPSIVAYMVHAQRSLDLQYETLKRHVRAQSYGMPLWRPSNGRKSEILKDSSLKNSMKKKLGTFGHVSFTSFHAAHIVSMGQGGGVFTNDEELARKVRMYRDWGRQSDIPRRTNGDKWPDLPADYDSRFIYEKMGYNLSPLDIQAAMGRVQLKRTEEIKAKRRANFEYLYEHLSKFEELVMPKWVDGADPSWFSFPLSYHNRGPLVEHLERNGIETRSMFAGNVLRHPMCSSLKEGVDYRSMLTEDSECNKILTDSFWVSCHPRLTQEDLDFMLGVFHSFFYDETA